MTKKETTPVTMISIPKPKFETLDIKIIGTSELITHAWSAKTKKEMLEKQQGKKTPRSKRNPEAEYQEAMYKFDEDGNPFDGHSDQCAWFGFPAVAFKNAAVRASQQFGFKMTESRQWFWTFGTESTDFVTIEGDKPYMREDMIRLNGKTADLRYRPGFKNWSTVLRVQINAEIIAPETIINLIAQSGFSVGIGEWRQEKNGQYGCFRVG